MNGAILARRTGLAGFSGVRHPAGETGAGRGWNRRSESAVDGMVTRTTHIRGVRAGRAIWSRPISLFADLARAVIYTARAFAARAMIDGKEVGCADAI